MYANFFRVALVFCNKPSKSSIVYSNGSWRNQFGLFILIRKLATFIKGWIFLIESIIITQSALNPKVEIDTI